MAIFILLLSFYIYILPIILIYYTYRFWSKKKKLSFLLIIILFFFYSPIVCDIGCNVCGLEEEYARNKVIKDLKSKKLNINNIEYTGHTGSCSYSYIYHDKSITIDYVILSTWIHGVKLNLYKHDQELLTPQTNKSNQETKQ